MIKLKADAGSHRAAQVPFYCELAAHHYPSACIDLIYLTPPMAMRAPSLRTGMHYVHMDWDRVLSTASGGRAMTDAGRELGYELRFSRYRSPVYGGPPR